MSYRLTKQLDSIPSVTIDEKLYAVGDVFEATDAQLENIKRVFEVEEVKDETVENKEAPATPQEPVIAQVDEDRDTSFDDKTSTFPRRLGK